MVLLVLREIHYIEDGVNYVFPEQEVIRSWHRNDLLRVRAPYPHPQVYMQSVGLFKKTDISPIANQIYDLSDYDFLEQVANYFETCQAKPACTYDYRELGPEGILELMASEVLPWDGSDIRSRHYPRF